MKDNCKFCGSKNTVAAEDLSGAPYTYFWVCRDCGKVTIEEEKP